MELMYGLGSLIFSWFLVKLAEFIARFRNKEVIVFLYLTFVAASGLIHFRIFKHGEIFGIVLKESLMLDIAALVFFLFAGIVPISIIRRKVIKDDEMK